MANPTITIPLDPQIGPIVARGDGYGGRNFLLFGGFVFVLGLFDIADANQCGTFGLPPRQENHGRPSRREEHL